MLFVANTALPEGRAGHSEYGAGILGGSDISHCGLQRMDESMARIELVLTIYKKKAVLHEGDRLLMPRHAGPSWLGLRKRQLLSLSRWLGGVALRREGAVGGSSHRGQL